MANKESLSADEYYKDYLQQTSKKNNTSKIIIGLLSMLVIGGGYYVWQQQRSLDTLQNTSTSKMENNKIVQHHINTKIEKKIEKKESISKKVLETKTHSTSKSSTLNNQNHATKPQMFSPKVIKDEVEPDIKKIDKVNVKKVLLPSIADNNSSKESKEINDLAHSLISAISEQKKEEKNIKVDTFNKIVLSENNKSSTIQHKSKHKAIAQELHKVLKNTTKAKNTYTKALKKEVKSRIEEMQYVTVKEGDTLFYIAKRIYGDAMKYPIIFEANPDILNDPSRISIGQKLRVPKLKESDK